MSAILLMRICPKKMKILAQRVICCPIFMAALFTITKADKQPNSSLDELIKEAMIHIDTIHVYYEILFIHENEEILSFATTWIYGKGIMLSEISQTKKNSA